MKYWDVVVVVCGVMSLFSSGSAKKGFILTSPKILDAGSTSYVTFTAFDATSPKGTLHLTLRNWYTEEMIANATVDVVGNLNMWVELALPPSPADLRAKLRVSGSFGDAEKEVRVRRNSVLTFVQTDKPVYKPGQTVRFRVLPLDSQLRPLGPDTVADVWIEDPSNIRVSQWKQIKFTEGIVQLELPLSDEPPLGEWSIKTLVRQVAHTQKFHVEKYVLPKFDVKIKPPAVIMADADTIPLEICAWYSYGKKVDGTFKMKATYKRRAWEDMRRTIPSVEQSGLISGCQTVYVNTQDVLLQTSEFGFRTLEFFAEVAENSTALTGNATATSEITHSPLKLQFLGSDGGSDHFKPGIPLYGELSVHKPNGDPAVKEKIEICAEYQTTSTPPIPDHLRRFERSYYLPPIRRPTESHCRTFSTDRRGRVRFSVPPKSEHCTRITLEARAVGHPPVPYREHLWDKKLSQPFTSLVLRPWHTPSGHQVQIQPRFDPMECEAPLRVRVRYTARESAPVKFYHQMTSRGRIVEQGSHRRLFHPRLSPEESKKAFDLGPAAPSDLQVGEFTLRLVPRGPWGPAVRLLVFYVRDDGEIVADSRKFDVAHCLPNKVQLHFRHEQQSPGTEASLLLSAEPHSVCGIGLVDRSVEFLGRRNRFNKGNIFRVVEKLDVGREAAPHQVTEDYCQMKEDVGATVNPFASRYSLSRKISLHSDTAMAFEEAGMSVLSNFEVETRPCEEAFLQGPIALHGDLMPPGGPGDGLVNLRARVVPETPKVTTEVEKPEVEKEEEDREIRSYFPETWLWEMHTVGASGEMALSPRLPDSVTRWVGGAACVHPSRGLGVAEGAGVTAFRPFFVSLRLPYSLVRGERAPLLVTVFNYLDECLPIKLRLDPSQDFESEFRSHTMCVCGGESRGHRFMVRPTTLGLVNVTVYGFSTAEDDACGTGITARLVARDAVTRQIRVEAEGFPKEEVFNYFVCPETTNGSYAAEIDLLLPEDVVEGSERAYVTVTGDLLGPSLHGGLGNLVRMPAGCGEQNMALLTPNVLVLDYLRATSRLTPELEQECVNNMKTGYQRQLQYRHPDGSFSAFGPGGGEGSLWLTAFVVRTLGQARKHVPVDEQDLGLSTAWILSRQFENGCFQPSGFMLNKAMKGGLDSGGDPQSLAPLTAYVIISLLESGTRRPGQLPVRSALSCVSAEPAPSAYALALFAYAAALAKESALAEKYLRQLEARAIVKGSEKYWSESSLSVSVETAGYFVLARMSLQGRGASGGVLSVVRWMARQRNAVGGFVSTQDTVVALQALSLYSSLQSRSVLDMGLVVEGDEMVKGFRLEEASRLVTQVAPVPTLPAVLDLQAVGEGCALVQFILRYYVSRVAASVAFDLRVDARRLGSFGCNQPRIDICTRYRIPEQTSNMVVVSIKMASGFSSDERSLLELQSDSNVELMRHDVDGNHVNLYFNELTNAEKCFKFFLKQDLEVDDIRPASVKLYDYYEPEHEITKEYIIPSTCITTSLTPSPTLSADDAEGTTRLQTFSEPTTTAIYHRKTDVGTTRETDDGDLTIENSTGTAHGGIRKTEETRQEHATTEADTSEAATAGTDTAETHSVTAVSDDVPRASENPTTKAFVATSTESERATVSGTVGSETEGDTDGTTIPGGFAQAPADSTTKADSVTSTDSERLDTKGDSETEFGTDKTTISDKQESKDFTTEASYTTSTVSVILEAKGDSETEFSSDGTTLSDVQESKDFTTETSYATSTHSERLEIESDSVTEFGTDGITISDEQESKDFTTKADPATSTDSERLVTTEDSETEDETDGTTAQASEELATADESTTESKAIETSSNVNENKVSLDALPELDGDDMDENLGENALVMADDSRMLQTNEQHLVNFVDREDDLDFPDGIEGNMPVTVLPPDEEIWNLLEDIPNITGCPVCVSEFPENFTEIYCSSALTLRILIRNAKRGSARILNDLSRHLPESRPTKAFAKLEYDTRCRCPQLLKSGSTHLLTGPGAVWNADSIRLTERTIVVTASSHTKADARLKEARTECPVA